MIRKSLIIALIAAAAFGAAPQASAQKSIGEWTLFPVYSNGVSDIVDTKDRVYYLSSGRLYSFDKNNNETYSYSVANKLSDNEITSITYNVDEGYLLIVYASANMDALYDNGKVVNMSDIHDTSISEQKEITGVAISDGRFYVAMPNMIVVYDAKKLTVLESQKYQGLNIGAIAVSRGNLYFYNSELQYGYRGKITNRLPRENELDNRNFGVVKAAYAIGDNVLLYLNDNTLKVIEKMWVEDWPTSVDYADCKPLQAPRFYPDGTACVVTATQLLYFDADGKMTNRVTLPEALAGQRIAFNENTKDLWGGDLDGIANYSLDENNNVTVLSEKARPQGTSTVKEAAFMALSSDGSRIYVSNLGATDFRTVGAGDATYIMQTTDYIENGKIFDASLYNATAVTAHTRNNQKANNNTRMYSPERIAVDPNKPNRYVIATFVDGVYVVEDNKEVIVFTKDNMPVKPFWDANGGTCYDVKFDAAGNLWVGVWNLTGGSMGYTGYNMLPAEKYNGDLSKVTIDDWVRYSMDGYIGDKDMNSIITKKGMHLSWNRKFSDQCFLDVLDTKGTYKNTADDQYLHITSVTDQDGKPFDAYRWLCGIEDARGRLWMGTANGVVEITDPSKLTDPTYRFTRLKVPRNDGTIYADYLLESEQVNAIATDAADRKWIATENSGVYLVSQAGDKIIEHFTTTNSLLPTNSVQSVMCDPKSNVVYFGTANGILAYNSTSAPASEDYSEVYAYPNPVRPDYTGWITIKGLMNNSLVKITDAAGNMVAQMRSDGGMAVWDGCNVNGQRVRSGVYFVFASQNANGSSSGAVTKILVVN